MTDTLTYYRVFDNTTKKWLPDSIFIEWNDAVEYAFKYAVSLLEKKSIILATHKHIFQKKEFCDFKNIVVKRFYNQTSLKQW